MATSKTLTPTNVTIQIPAFADKPDQRVNSNCIDKEADAINALSDQIANLFELIWTNPSPDSSFSAQTVDAVVSGKQGFAVVFRYNTSANLYVTQLFLADVRSVATIVNSNGSFQIATRIVEIASGSGKVAFGGGYKFTGVSSDTNDNTVMIPYKIYAIKK